MRKIKENELCENCIERYAIHIHHIDRNRKNNSDSNLMAVCRYCHNAIHKEINYKEFEERKKIEEMTYLNSWRFMNR